MEQLSGLDAVVVAPYGDIPRLLHHPGLIRLIATTLTDESDQAVEMAATERDLT